MPHRQPENTSARSTFGLLRFARVIGPVLAVTLSFGVSAPTIAAERSASVAPANLNAPGPEGQMLAAQVGSWTVTETVWDTPGATPVISKGLIAKRRLVGNLLGEELRSAPGTATVRRDFLTFNRVEGRWEYMSFDTRSAVGMMTAQSYGAEKDGRIEIFFQPLALPGGSAVPGDAAGRGQMLRMRQEIIRLGPDHIVKDQYFSIADGLGGEWLAHRYDALRAR